jgi:hypothetical protein
VSRRSYREDCALTEDDEPATGQRRRRRRFAIHLAPVAVLLLVGGAVFADDDGALGTVGLVVLAQGIGLAVALIWLAAGHNPLSRG